MILYVSPSVQLFAYSFPFVFPFHCLERISQENLFGISPRVSYVGQAMAAPRSHDPNNTAQRDYHWLPNDPFDEFGKGILALDPRRFPNFESGYVRRLG